MALDLEREYKQRMKEQSGRNGGRTKTKLVIHKYGRTGIPVICPVCRAHRHYCTCGRTGKR